MAQAAAVTKEIQWREWSPEVFEQAKAEGKLVLLDSGATWCHWCHVMDRVTYEDPEVVELVERRFIPVRIDRDRLPDVDARLQRAPALFSPQGGAGGWPLTVVLTPHGSILMKATFLPPRADRRYGIGIGLAELLRQLDEQWRTDPGRIDQAGAELQRRIKEQEAQAYRRGGEVSREQLDALHEALREEYDPAHGGFGDAPKFFVPAALDWLLLRGFCGDDEATRMLVKTLQSMARGGVYDQLGGGFHRYSVDARWAVPHFEKMAYDNAALLSVYADAYAAMGNQEFADVARQTLGWVRDVLSDADGRGFYASQDADVGLDDDGDYFTWTVEEMRSALPGDDAELMTEYYDVSPEGDMHGRDGRNVLHVLKTPEQLARLLGRDPAELRKKIARGRKALLEARRRRTEPAVDRTIFADLNGMLIDAHLTAWRRLGDEAARERALAVLDRLLTDLRDDRGVFAHYRQGGQLEGVGMLADQAWMGRALLHAYQATADEKYLAAARQLGDYILRDLTDTDGGLLNAPITNGPVAPAEGGVRVVADSSTPAAWRSWEDSPVRSAASVAAEFLTDLAVLADYERYSQAALAALESFAGADFRRFGTLLAGYGLALEQHLHGPRKIIIAGAPGDPATAALLDAAQLAYVPGVLVMALNPDSPAHAAILKRLRLAVPTEPTAYVCTRLRCVAPARSAAELTVAVEELRRTP